VRMNYGGFDGATAIGFSGAAVLGRGVLTTGDRLSASVAAGWGQAAVAGYSKEMFGSRASLQFTW
jgi:hypothetical protein